MAPHDNDVPAAVFVYGTLKPGRARWPALAPFVDRSNGPRVATVHGRLWDTAYGWPAMTDGGDDVPGVVVPLDPARCPEVLARLDLIEGVASGLFERVRVTTADGTLCWTYRWPGATAGFAAVEGAW
ncbi:gamma-glutamylcyclotransferase [Geodermatophilus sp. SYSU D00697]